MDQAPKYSKTVRQIQRQNLAGLCSKCLFVSLTASQASALFGEKSDLLDSSNERTDREHSVVPEEVQDGEHVCFGPSGGLELGDHDGHKALQVGGEQVLLHGAGAGQQPQAGFNGVWPHYQVAHLVYNHTVAPPLVHKELHAPGHHVIVCIKFPRLRPLLEHGIKRILEDVHGIKSGQHTQD